MDLVVGKIPAMAGATDKKPEAPAPIEAKVLHVRQPRRPKAGGQTPAPQTKVNTRQGRSPQVDPPGARVLVLLVPDAYRLPEDLMDGQYRIFLRIVRR